MTKEDPELASSNEEQCVTCMVSRAVMMVYPCNHVALCRLCFVKMIKHVSKCSVSHSHLWKTFNTFNTIVIIRLSKKWFFEINHPILFIFVFFYDGHGSSNHWFCIDLEISSILRHMELKLPLIINRLEFRGTHSMTLLIESSSKNLPNIYQTFTNHLPKIYQK